jgi:methylmalonic aciduria homocystinuria type C protein
VHRYNDALPAELGARIKTAPPAGAAALTLLVANSRALWPCFLKAYAVSESLQRAADPLQSYLERALAAALACRPPGAAPPRVYWSHRHYDDLEGGGGYVAMQRMAACAGVAYLDHVSHLSIHPTYGPWVALRCCVVFEDTPAVWLAAPPPPLPNPLTPPQQEVVRHALEAAVAASAAEAGGTSMVGGRIAWRAWLAVREAAGPGHPWRYSQDQVMYHYTGQRCHLEAAVQALKQLQAP